MKFEVLSDFLCIVKGNILLEVEPLNLVLVQNDVYHSLGELYLIEDEPDIQLLSDFNHRLVVLSHFLPREVDAELVEHHVDEVAPEYDDVELVGQVLFILLVLVDALGQGQLEAKLVIHANEQKGRQDGAEETPDVGNGIIHFPVVPAHLEGQRGLPDVEFEVLVLSHFVVEDLGTIDNDTPLVLSLVLIGKN